MLRAGGIFIGLPIPIHSTNQTKRTFVGFFLGGNLPKLPKTSEYWLIHMIHMCIMVQYARMIVCIYVMLVVLNSESSNSGEINEMLLGLYIGFSVL